MKPEPAVSQSDHCIEGHVPGEADDDHGEHDKLIPNEEPLRIDRLIQTAVLMVAWLLFVLLIYFADYGV